MHCQARPSHALSMDINIQIHIISEHLKPIALLQEDHLPKLLWLNFWYISIPYSHCFQDHSHTGKQRICPATVHVLECHSPRTSFSKIVGSSWVLVQWPRYEQKDQYFKIVYFLDPKGIEAWKSFTWEDITHKKDSAKVFNKFESSFQTPTLNGNSEKKLITLSSRKIRQ